MKRFVILKGSPRKNGNTNALVSAMEDVLNERGCPFTSLDLFDLRLEPCVACRSCQRDWGVFGCPKKDDMQLVFDAVLQSDCIVLASPIYSWYCTPPMKTALDRLVYGMNKYYGEERGPSLWQGKSLVLVTTCGYRPEKGADLREEGMKRYCKHSGLNYMGMLAERHLGYGSTFMDEEKAARVRRFTEDILNT